MLKGVFYLSSCRSSHKFIKASVSDVFIIEKILNTKIKTPLNLSDNSTLVMHCFLDISSNLKLKSKDVSSWGAYQKSDT